jgi:hypothetical protein
VKVRFAGVREDVVVFMHFGAKVHTILPYEKSKHSNAQKFTRQNYTVRDYPYQLSGKVLEEANFQNSWWKFRFYRAVHGLYGPFAHKRSRLYCTMIHPTTHVKQRRSMEIM